MGQDKLSSFLLSLCLHLSVFALVLWWPAPKLVPKAPVELIRVSEFVTLGAPGKKSASNAKAKGASAPSAEKAAASASPSAASSAGKELKPSSSKAEAPELIADTKPSAVPVRSDEKKAVPKEAKAETKAVEPKKPEAKPVEAKASEAKPIETKKAEAKPAEAKKPEAKPEEKKSAAKTNAPKKAEAKKAESKKDEAKKETAQKKDQQKGGSKDKAAAKSTKAEKNAAGGDGEKTASKKTGLSSLEKALAGIESSVQGGGDEDFGDGPGGSGGSGYGDLGPYEQIIVQSIKRNWRLPESADRRSISATVSITLDQTGRITSYTLLQSSGNPVFDDSLGHAVTMTQEIDEAPPVGRLQNGEFRVDITFYPDN